MIRSLRVLLCIAVLASCALAQTTLNGAGATFPYPIYSKWFNEYHNAASRHSDQLSVDRQRRRHSPGAGRHGGFRRQRRSDDRQQIAESKVKVLHVPTVLGAVVPAYNIPGVSAEVKFTPEVLAEFFWARSASGTTRESPRSIPGVNFPDQNITVVHRSDGSGTTYIFTDYLSKVSPDWQNNVGKGTSVKWPVGIGGKGNEGVAGTSASCRVRSATSN